MQVLSLHRFIKDADRVIVYFDTASGWKPQDIWATFNFIQHAVEGVGRETKLKLYDTSVRDGGEFTPENLISGMRTAKTGARVFSHVLDDFETEQQRGSPKAIVMGSSRFKEGDPTGLGNDRMAMLEL